MSQAPKRTPVEQGYKAFLMRVMEQEEARMQADADARMLAWVYSDYAFAISTDTLTDEQKLAALDDAWAECRYWNPDDLDRP